MLLYDLYAPKLFTPKKFWVGSSDFYPKPYYPKPKLYVFFGCEYI